MVEEYYEEWHLETIVALQEGRQWLWGALIVTIFFWVLCVPIFVKFQLHDTFFAIVLLVVMATTANGVGKIDLVLRRSLEDEERRDHLYDIVPIGFKLFLRLCGGSSQAATACFLGLFGPFNVIPIATSLKESAKAIKEHEVAAISARAKARKEALDRSAIPPIALSVLPRIKNILAPDEGKQATGGATVIQLPEMDSPLCKQIGDLHVFYVCDQGTCYQYLTKRDCDQANLDLDKLHEFALKNMRELIRKKASVIDHLYDDKCIGAMKLDGENEASLLLIDSLWATAIKEEFPTAPIACIPRANVCMYGDAGDPEAIASLQRVIRLLTEKIGERDINQHLYARKADGTWETFPPQA
jgi:hypothetical protein